MKNRPTPPLSKKTTLIIGLMFCLFGLFLLLYAIFGTPKRASISPPVATETEEVTITPIDSPAVVDNVLDDVPTDRLSAVHGVDGTDNLVAIASDYTSKDELIHKDAYQPLMDLIDMAHADGISLHVVSAYRSYDHQKRIWERKWGDTPDDDTNKALEILEYSSFPGTSRHHWGTDVDFNSVSPAYWQSDEGQKTFQWLQDNAPRYGFCQTYGDHRSAGYNTEAWHWSYIPVANVYYAQITKPEILAIALAQDVRGSAAVEMLSADLFDYITSISPCQYDIQPATPSTSPPNSQ